MLVQEPLLSPLRCPLSPNVAAKAGQQGGWGPSDTSVRLSSRTHSRAGSGLLPAARDKPTLQKAVTVHDHGQPAKPLPRQVGKGGQAAAGSDH